MINSKKTTPGGTLRLFKVSTLIQLLLLLSLFLTFTLARDVSVRHRRDGGVELIVNVNVNGAGKRSSSTSSTSSSSSKSQEESTPMTSSQQEETSSSSSSQQPEQVRLDSTTKEIATQVHDAVSSKMATEIAESLLQFANEVKKIHDAIPNSGLTQAQQEFKTQLLAVTRDLTSKAANPSAELMVSSLSYLNAVKKQEPPSVSLESSSNNQEAKTLFILPAIGVASNVMNFVDGIGTYSTSISKAGKWLSGTASQKLQKWGFERAAKAASTVGTGVSNFSEKKLGPIEAKVAKKIAPVVKSKPYLAVKRSINLVAGVTGLHGVAKSIGLLNVAKLPKNFKSLKTTLTKATSAVKNRAAIMKNIRRVATNAKKVVSNVRKTSLISKLSTAHSTNSAIGDVKSGMELFKRNGSKKNTSSQKSGGGANNRSGSTSRPQGNSNRRPNGKNNSGANNNKGKKQGSTGSSSNSSGSNSSSSKSIGNKYGSNIRRKHSNPPRK
ncbi:hypothetical protein C9374_012987 [Naegleria lovaniensis]|uniref:Uncharacterized protein n=1 Tax=Naegleria lovaniensis TaxID=51637 RepID=A0AA88GC70_NAELO|nr:uncharacterized protein C9374_012987 [Naegleria lovaniensis]KAG2372957.1 hypothetical protein C9374_012987 [Naegleria lovaniensis]